MGEVLCFFLILFQCSCKNKYIILFDDMIQFFMEDIFCGFVKFDMLEFYLFKMICDVEYFINDEIDESYVEKMFESMKQCLIVEFVWVIYDQDMLEDMVEDL